MAGGWLIRLGKSLSVQVVVSGAPENKLLPRRTEWRALGFAGDSPVGVWSVISSCPEKAETEQSREGYPAR